MPENTWWDKFCPKTLTRSEWRENTGAAAFVAGNHKLTARFVQATGTFRDVRMFLQ